jgi:hypothetical protein
VCLGAERKGMTRYLLSLAARGETESLLRKIGELRVNSRHPTFKARLEDLMTYVSHNMQRIENASWIDFYGSGAVEKAVDVTICKRL